MKKSGFVVVCACLLALSGAAVQRMDRSKFLVGAYCVAHQDEKHIAEMKECGIDFAVGYVNQASRDVLDFFEKYDMGVVISHTYPSRKWLSKPGTLRDQHPREEYEKAIVKFRSEYDHPAIWMIESEDEPSALDFPYIGELAKLTDDCLPETPMYLSLLPNYATVAENTAAEVESQLGTKTYREHVEAYCRQIPLDYISYDFYVYSPNLKRRQELFAQMYDNFEVVADCCRKTGRSFWYVPQVNSNIAGPGEVLEWQSANRLRFQAYSAMAYGAEVINWACWSPGWWTNNVLTASGEKTEQYEKLKTVNAELHRLGPKYMLFRNVATHHVGPFPQNVFEATGKKQLKELETGYFRHVRTREDTPLLIGEMVPRKDALSDVRALFVVPSGDFEDKAPSVRTVQFGVLGRNDVRVFGAEGSVSYKRGEDGTCTFPLAENAAALIVTRKVK